VTTPSSAAAANEEEAWIRLGVEFLEPADKEVKTGIYRKDGTLTGPGRAVNSKSSRNLARKV